MQVNKQVSYLLRGDKNEKNNKHLTATFYNKYLFSRNRKNYDDFTGDTILNTKENKLDGSSFLGMKHAWLDFYCNRNNNIRTFLKLTLSFGNLNYHIKSSLAGSSLFIKLDSTIYDFKDNGQTTYVPNVQYGFAVSTAFYAVDKSFIEKIANAKEIKVRILGSNDEYLDFEFGEDNFAIAKKFVKKINK
jgi:hypothetical protein